MHPWMQLQVMTKLTQFSIHANFLRQGDLNYGGYSPIPSRGRRNLSGVPIFFLPLPLPPCRRQASGCCCYATCPPIAAPSAFHPGLLVVPAAGHCLRGPAPPTQQLSRTASRSPPVKPPPLPGRRPLETRQPETLTPPPCRRLLTPPPTPGGHTTPSLLMPFLVNTQTR